MHDEERICIKLTECRYVDCVLVSVAANIRRGCDALYTA